MTKTVYVAREDMDTWKRATLLAKQQNIALSELVAIALRAYVKAYPQVNFGPSHPR